MTDEAAMPPTLTFGRPDEKPDVIPAQLPLDTSYSEPQSIESLKQRAASFTREAPGTIDDVQIILRDMVARIESLEGALLPFAVQAMMMANARMALTANRQPQSPAGGIFICNPNNTTMKPCEQMFFSAIDALGRKRTETHLMDVFKKFQEALAAGEECAKHLEEGGKLQ